MGKNPSVCLRGCPVRSVGGKKPLVQDAEQAVAAAARSVVAICVSGGEERHAGVRAGAEPKRGQVFK